MKIRIVTEMPELRKMQEIEKQIWQAKDDVISPLIMKVTVNKGGLVLAAYDDDDRMIGILWSFPARKGKQCVLWSHVTGVLAQYQSKRVGYALKQYQRQWAIENDYDAIHWTFDPMQARNANFNLRRLGVIVDTYHENIYGELQDALNIGLPSDRLEAIWKLNDEKVIRLANPQFQASLPEIDYVLEEHQILVSCKGDIIDSKDPAQWTHPLYFIEIPADFLGMMPVAPALIRDWQAQVRSAMQIAFANGYQVFDFLRRDGRCWYVLRAK